MRTFPRPFIFLKSSAWIETYNVENCFFFSLFSVVFFPNLKQIEIRNPFNEMTEELL